MARVSKAAKAFDDTSGTAATAAAGKQDKLPCIVAPVHVVNVCPGVSMHPVYAPLKILNGTGEGLAKRIV